MLIVSSADENYAPHFAAMLHSAWTHHPFATFYLLDCGIKPETLAALKGFATTRGIRLTVIKVDLSIAMLRDLPMIKALSVAAYARFLIPDLFPDLERALYLDADCIVVGDLTALWRLEMGEAPIAAVSDRLGAQIEREIGLDFDEHSYINSGVMLMNLTAWRRDNLAATAIAFIRQHNPRFLDQSGINAVCAGKIILLTEEWNLQMHKPRRADQWLEPRIIHYVSERKPWVYGDVPFAAIYLHHRSQTPFPLKLPRSLQRSRLRRLLNLLIGRRKYWEQLILMHRCKAFALGYFDRIASYKAASH